MRLVIISDTHVQHEALRLPEGDVLIHCGDFTGSGSIEQIAKFNAWLGRQPHAHKLVIAGNHDRLFETDPGLARSLLTNATYLQDSGAVIGGYRFWGSPWQPAFMDWAFNVASPEALAEKWARIPEGTDVLITHCPPKGLGDRCQDGTHAGCPELLKRILAVKPEVHVYGHIHEGYGIRNELGITFGNAAVLNERYRLANEPLVIDLP